MTVMVTGSKYGLVYPNSEAVYAANRLIFLFGGAADFRALLDDLYEEAIPLLDTYRGVLHPTSSLQDHAARFGVKGGVKVYQRGGAKLYQWTRSIIGRGVEVR
jgi:hypothetical protein